VSGFVRCADCERVIDTSDGRVLWQTPEDWDAIDPRDWNGERIGEASNREEDLACHDPFTVDSTEGFSQVECDLLNEAVTIRVRIYGEDAHTASERVSNLWVDGADLRRLVKGLNA
jgi:hypothetical protein